MQVNDGRGSVQLKDLSSGDEVLVERTQGQLVYEPVLGFLHAVSGKASTGQHYVTVRHSTGDLRVSASHIVFVVDEDGVSRADKFAADLEVGDQLLAVISSIDTIVPSKVLAIRHDAGNDGMYAPLTPTGTLVVDGVVASNYAAPPISVPLAHSTAHAVLFPVRLYNKLTSWTYQDHVQKSEVHGFVEVAYQQLRLGVLHRLLAASQHAISSVAA